jgi:hypothetical protein
MMFVKLHDLMTQLPCLSNISTEVSRTMIFVNVELWHKLRLALEAWVKIVTIEATSTDVYGPMRTTPSLDSK